MNHKPWTYGRKVHLQMDLSRLSLAENVKADPLLLGWELDPISHQLATISTIRSHDRAISQLKDHLVPEHLVPETGEVGILSSL